MRTFGTIALSFLLFAGSVLPVAGKSSLYSIGIARVDVTPGYPVRLAGYAVRSSESEGVAQRIWAKAMAIGTDRQKPAILITVDNCGVPVNVRNEVVAELAKRRKIDPDKVTIGSSHTHSAPLLHGYLTNLFLGPLPPQEDARVARYTRELTQSLIQAACQALDSREPGRLSHGKSTADFAANRRSKGGPADHDVPVLMVHSPDGKLRAVLAGYACHCTTLTGEFNKVCGDWAGYAQEYVEKDNPGALCMIVIGCGGDANPNPRPGFELAQQHGSNIAVAVRQVVAHPAKEISGKLVVRVKNICLPYDKLPTRTEWEAKLKEGGYIEQHARINLARLDRGESLPTHLPYMLQTWSFGSDLLMVFLPGEVTSEYSLRLKRELEASLLWVSAYANDVPCYIPSENVLKAGGYEGGASMVYYDRPTRFAPGIEDLIITSVHKIVPKAYKPRLK